MRFALPPPIAIAELMICVIERSVKLGRKVENICLYRYRCRYRCVRALVPVSVTFNQAESQAWISGLIIGGLGCSLIEMSE